MYLFIHTMISLLPDVIRDGNQRVIHDTVTLQYGVQVSVSQYKRLCNAILQDIIVYYFFNRRGKLFSKMVISQKAVINHILLCSFEIHTAAFTSVLSPKC